jgi:hypothetical protein
MKQPSAHSIIHLNCTLRRPIRVTTTIVALTVGATAAIAAAGCSSSVNGKSAGKGTEATSTESKSVTKALDLAATESSQVNSLRAKLTVRSSGTGTDNLTGTVKIQLKPQTIIEATFNVASAKSPAVQLDEILTGTAIYFKDPAFTKAAGKPWVEAKIAELPSKVGVSLGSLLQNLESSNPLDQAKLFTASRNAKAVGSAMIHGVQTVEYTGTYTPSVALAELAPNLRKLLGPTLQAIGPHPVQFEVWIDAHHIVRQARAMNNVHGQQVITNLYITSVNKPVQIAIPDPSQVAPLPKV